MESTDPATGQPLPPDAIQRILHLARAVHVYHIPPLTSTKGYTAATWTEDPKRHISTCRARIIETAIPSPPTNNAPDKLKVDIVLEDPSTGQLFAAAPYTAQAVVEPALDSSRFFALRVQDPTGRKATLGIGFEERSEAFDFSIALQEAQKALGLLVPSSSAPDHKNSQPPGSSGKQSQKPDDDPTKKKDWLKRDYSLKDGETITVNLSGTSFGRNRGGGGGGGAATRSSPSSQREEPAAASLSSFALPPPPPPGGGGVGSSFLPPPPSAKEARARKRLSAQEMGFDDGQFGEFA